MIKCVVSPGMGIWETVTAMAAKSLCGRHHYLSVLLCCAVTCTCVVGCESWSHCKVAKRISGFHGSLVVIQLIHVT